VMIQYLPPGLLNSVNKLVEGMDLTVYAHACSGFVLNSDGVQYSVQYDCVEVGRISVGL